MATQQASAAPDHSPAPTVRLTARLDLTLAELRRQGCKALWIEASKADLTTLVREGDSDAVVLHPDPAVNRAYYAGVEIRHGDQPLTCVFRKGGRVIQAKIGAAA
jgi:hypothetical protein